MTANPDIVIRGGTVADGRGGDLYEADVAIKDGRISEVGKVSAKGKEEIDARGKLVAPGFVDVHTHYDGQVTWAEDITPSSQNGVTTAIMGNCGVGFAPCKPEDHRRLIQLMEGVEDIPEPVLSAGIPWSWESFPDYMEWLSKRNFDIDIGAQLPHAALRVYVMGERAAIPRLSRTTRRWRHWCAKPCALARWASRPRARSTTAPRPAITRLRSRRARTN
jgi:N-acyl-D-aspartate/D-glutamate deacylase